MSDWSGRCHSKNGDVALVNQIQQNMKLLQPARMAERQGRIVEYLSRKDALILDPNLNIVGYPEF